MPRSAFCFGSAWQRYRYRVLAYAAVPIVTMAPHFTAVSNAAGASARPPTSWREIVLSHSKTPPVRLVTNSLESISARAASVGEMTRSTEIQHSESGAMLSNIDQRPVYDVEGEAIECFDAPDAAHMRQPASGPAGCAPCDEEPAQDERAGTAVPARSTKLQPKVRNSAAALSPAAPCQSGSDDESERCGYPELWRNHSRDSGDLCS